MVKIHQHVKFQANPSMHYPANARKPLRTDGHAVKRLRLVRWTNRPMYRSKEGISGFGRTDGRTTRKHNASGAGIKMQICILKLINMRGPSYLDLTRSISWLLMPWLLTSPGHQQPWCWICRIGRFLSYLRKDFNYLCRINAEKWHKM